MEDSHYRYTVTMARAPCMYPDFVVSGAGGNWGHVKASWKGGKDYATGGILINY